MKKIIKILQTIIVTPLCLVGGAAIGLLGMPFYLLSLVISDIWR